MAKQCSLCGERFSDAARHCDQDGSVLVPVAGRRGLSVAWKVVLGGVAAVVILSLMGWWLWQRHVGLNIDVILDGVYLASSERTDGRQEGGLFSLLEDLAGLVEEVISPQAVIRLRLANHTGIPARVQSARYTLTLGDRKLASGVWEPQGSPQPFLPGEEVRIDLLLQAETGAGIDAARELVAAPGAQITVEGEIRVAILGFTVPVPFKVQRIGLGGDATLPVGPLS